MEATDLSINVLLITPYEQSVFLLNTNGTGRHKNCHLMKGIRKNSFYILDYIIPYPGGFLDY